MKLINGKAVAQRIRDKVKEMVKALPNKPGMAAILVGDDPASHLYVSLKEKACEEAGIHFEKLLYPAHVPQQELIDKIHELNARPEINAILVQIPLPNQDEDAVVAAIDPNKDVDGFHPESKLLPPVAMGIMKLIDEAVIDGHAPIRGAKAALICSPLFARPLIELLAEQNVTIVDDSAEADIVIIAKGKPEMLKGDKMKNGAIVIDVGTTRVDHKLFGDVDANSVAAMDGWITPVPGGVGPVTVAMLLLNVVKADRLQSSVAS